MKPTKLFTEFSVIAIPFILTAFSFYLVMDSRPRFRNPTSLPASHQRLSLMLTQDGQLAVELFAGFGFEADSLQPVQGNVLGDGDRH